MQRCSYCGRENEDEAVHCKECGTALQLSETEPSHSRLRTAVLAFFDAYRRGYQCSAFQVPDTRPLRAQLRTGLLACYDSYRRGFGRRSPIFGIMAVAAPAWGFLLALVVGVCIDPHEGAAAIAFAVTILWALTFGAAFALLALLRGEKYRALGLVGLVVDLGPLLLAISKGQLQLQISSNVILLLGFSPSLLGLLVLLITCYFTHNRRLLGVACAVAVLLHGISAGLARQLYTWSAVGTSGATVGQGLLGELLIIGWAVIAVIALTKYALIEHAQIHR